ncbi:hypothetical protein AVEN_128687-1, partial [Araneus ventricosus]
NDDVVVSCSTCSSPQLDQVRESSRPQKITNQRRTFKEVLLQNYRRTIHAGYNGMAFTPWVTLPVEKSSRSTSPIPPRATTLATMRQHNRTWGDDDVL